MIADLRDQLALAAWILGAEPRPGAPDDDRLATIHDVASTLTEPIDVGALADRLHERDPEWPWIDHISYLLESWDTWQSIAAATIEADEIAIDRDIAIADLESALDDMTRAADAHERARERAVHARDRAMSLLAREEQALLAVARAQEAA